MDAPRVGVAQNVRHFSNSAQFPESLHLAELVEPPGFDSFWTIEHPDHQYLALYGVEADRPEAAIATLKAALKEPGRFAAPAPSTGTSGRVLPAPRRADRARGR